MNSWFRPGGFLAHVFYCAGLIGIGIALEQRWGYMMPFRSHTVSAVAVMHPLRESGVSGVVTFHRERAGVRVVVTCSGLTPGAHGFHVHAHGDARCSDGMCTGDHFNPTGAKHGGPDSPERHVGDFGNLVADAAGVVRAEFIDTHIELEGPRSIIGRSLIIHADPDDLVSQPSGNAGARIACGVIGIAQNAEPATNAAAPQH